jgi:peptide chain release factor 1
MKLQELVKNNAHADINRERKDKIGSGQRGDKIRTYRFQDNLILDHRTGQKFPLDSWLKGK